MSGGQVPAWRTTRLKAAIDGSLAELQRWMPWAKSEPSEVPVIELRVALLRAE